MLSFNEHQAITSYWDNVESLYETLIPDCDRVVLNNLIAESSIEDIKSKIIDMVKELTHIKELQPVFNILYKTKIEDGIKDALSEKGIATRKNIDFLTNLILFDSNADIMDKITFVEDLAVPKELIQPNKILKSTTMKVDEIAPIMNTSVFNDIKQDVMNWKTVDGFGSAEVGKGEAYFVLFGHKVSKGKSGDLDVNGQEVEIKGSAGRPRGQKGYNSPVGAYKYMQETLPGFDRKLHSFAPSKLKNWKKVLDESGKTPAQIKKMFVTAFGLMYNDNTRFSKYSRKWMNKIVAEGQIQPNAHHYLTALQLDYYKDIEGYYSTMFVNPNKFTAINIKDGADYISNMNKFSISPFSWKGAETRNSVNAITYDK